MWKWRRVIKDEVYNARSGSSGGYLRLIVEEAVKALCVTAKKKRVLSVSAASLGAVMALVYDDEGQLQRGIGIAG